MNWVGFQEDVTERREREQQLQRKTERLDEFASVVSHDLQSPLTLAGGHLELAREECDSDHLEAIADAHGRMEALIEDLLTLARQGERIGETEAIALDELATQCWESVMAADTSLHIDTDQHIEADRNRLRQLLENLFQNAVEHAGPAVTVTVGEMADGFYVADDGPGIPEETRDTVFEAGYSTSEEGTGFGLPIVKRVVGAHDWTIRITESADGGARFEITGVECRP